MTLMLPGSQVRPTRADVVLSPDAQSPEGFAFDGDTPTPDELGEAVARLEAATGKTFGRGDRPLVLTAWRDDDHSAAIVPWIGVNDVTEESLVAATGDAELGPDAYQQLIRAFGRVVAGVPAADFDDALNRLKWTRGLVNDCELAHEDWEEIVRRYKRIYQQWAGTPFPQDPAEQLCAAVAALAGPEGRSVAVEVVPYEGPNRTV